MNLNTEKNTENDFIQSLTESESIMLSIVIISKGLINNTKSTNTFNDNLSEFESQDNIAILNITHTDSYKQELKKRIESMYSTLGAKYIFPLAIWKNNIEYTKSSTGNFNRYINEDFNEINQFRINIMIDNIKQNIPKYNYIMSYKVINYLSNISLIFGLEQIYFSEWINSFKTDNLIKLSNYMKKKYNIKNIIMLQNTDDGLSKNQIKYFRQYGILHNNKNNIVKPNKRKRKIQELEQKVEQKIEQEVEQETINNSNNNIIELDSFEFDYEL